MTDQRRNPIPSIEFIQSQVRTERYGLTIHATIVMRERDITDADIELALLNGEVIETYRDDYPFPSCLVLGWRGADRPLHIVCLRADIGPALRIITVYEPDDVRWDNDFKTRKD